MMTEKGNRVQSGKSTFAFQRALKRSFHGFVSYVLIKHVRAIGIIIWFGALLIIFYGVTTLFFFTPQAEPVAVRGDQATLSKEIIDELELWVEEQNSEFERTLPLKPGAYFDTNPNQTP